MGRAQNDGRPLVWVSILVGAFALFVAYMVFAPGTQHVMSDGDRLDVNADEARDSVAPEGVSLGGGRVTLRQDLPLSCEQVHIEFAPDVFGALFRADYVLNGDLGTEVNEASLKLLLEALHARLLDTIPEAQRNIPGGLKVYILVFADAERAKHAGLAVARAFYPVKGDPDFIVSTGQIEDLKSPVGERIGLSRERRTAIFKKIMAVEGQINREMEVMMPMLPNHALQVGDELTLTEEVYLMADHPDELQGKSVDEVKASFFRTGSLIPGMTIRVMFRREVSDKSPSGAWYYVTVLNPARNGIGEGWVNPDALSENLTKNGMDMAAYQEATANYMDLLYDRYDAALVLRNRKTSW